LHHLDRDVPWRPDEEATLRRSVEAGDSWASVSALLPGRTAIACKTRAQVLGISRGQRRKSDRRANAWTPAEDEVIRAGIAAGETSSEIAERLPDRTLKAVEGRRFLVKGKAEPRVTNQWTQAEDSALREGFALGRRWKEIAEELPGRTAEAAATRARKELGLKRGVQETSG
jgi:hypothetical protein